MSTGKNRREEPKCVVYYTKSWVIPCFEQPCRNEPPEPMRCYKLVEIKEKNKMEKPISSICYPPSWEMPCLSLPSPIHPLPVWLVCKPEDSMLMV